MEIYEASDRQGCHISILDDDDGAKVRLDDEASGEPRYAFCVSGWGDRQSVQLSEVQMDDLRQKLGLPEETQEIISEAVRWAREAGGPAYDESEEWCAPIAKLAALVEGL